MKTNDFLMPCLATSNESVKFNVFENIKKSVISPKITQIMLYLFSPLSHE